MDDSATLFYNVTDLNGAIYGLGLSGGNLSSSGPGSGYAENLFGLSGFGQELYASNLVDDSRGTLTDELGLNTATGPINFGSGAASPFDLVALAGNTSGIDRTATDFTFITGPAPIPEPSFLKVLGIGLFGLMIAARRKMGRPA